MYEYGCVTHEPLGVQGRAAPIWNPEVKPNLFWCGTSMGVVGEKSCARGKLFAEPSINGSDFVSHFDDLKVGVARAKWAHSTR